MVFSIHLASILQVGKTYGLWKCVDTVASDPVPGKAEAVVS